MSDIAEFLDQQMSRGQGYKLLQGFPPPKLMQDYESDGMFYEGGCKERMVPYGDNLGGNAHKGLIVGVIPSPYCNPTVEGCGFCTFPHSPYTGANPNLVKKTLDKIRDEIIYTVNILSMNHRKVSSVYLGGGTANIISASQFEELMGCLRGALDISEAELSFEGVPAYFHGRKGDSLLDAMVAQDVGKRRISMGVQTFDTQWLERMGRTHFGSQQTIAEVVANAHARGMTVSGDFLINLPGQGVDAMMRDMETAVGIGFDQICVYNLVLFPGIGSKWSQDPEMLARMHPVETAYQNWLAVRRMLCEQGYQQTTLTNFERGAVRFDYEVQSYTLQKYNGLGFGPNAITLLSRGQSGIKTIMGEDYPFVEGRDDGRFKEYVYDARSLMVMYLARNLSRGYVHFADFAEDPRNHFQDEFALLEERGLAYVNETSLTLTERGMFFADAIIALIAKQEINYLKSLERRVIHLKKDDYEYSGGGM